MDVVTEAVWVSMPEDANRTVDRAMVDQLARLAELEIPADRREQVTDLLNGLLGDANNVNRFMDGRREVGPGVQFDHPELSQDDE